MTKSPKHHMHMQIGTTLCLVTNNRIHSLSAQFHQQTNSIQTTYTWKFIGKHALTVQEQQKPWASNGKLAVSPYISPPKTPNNEPSTCIDKRDSLSTLYLGFSHKLHWQGVTINERGSKTYHNLMLEARKGYNRPLLVLATKYQVFPHAMNMTHITYDNGGGT